MAPTHQKSMALLLLASFSLGIFFVPLTALAQFEGATFDGSTLVPSDPGFSSFNQGTYADTQIGGAPGSAGFKISPVLTGGLSGIFSAGGAKCSFGGLTGNIASTLGGLAKSALGAAGLGSLFGGSGSGSVSGAGQVGSSLPPLSQEQLGAIGTGAIPGESIASAVSGGGGSLQAVEGFGDIGAASAGSAEVSGIVGGLSAPGGDLSGISAGAGSLFSGISPGLISGAAGLLGGLLGGGGGEVPVSDKVVRNEISKARGDLDELVKKECILDPITKAITAILLRSLTSSIIGWIQGGQGGFVSNFEKEFQRQLDIRGGEFLNQITGINLCGNIGAFLNISLRTPGLRQRLECTVTDIIKNVQGFFKNFEQGGWPVFIRLALEPQNNPYGAYLIALDAKIASESSRSGSFSANFQAGAGFLGFRVKDTVCEPITSDVLREKLGRDKNCITTDSVKTPGQTVAFLLNKSVGVGIDWAVAADEIDEAITAIINALINKLLVSSFGDSGQGIFEPSLSGGASITPGDFSSSGVMTQYNAEIMRSDLAIRVLDDREIKAVQGFFASATTSIQKNFQSDFDAARQIKRNVVLIKSELLARRAALLTTTDLFTVQRLAEERILLTNLLDGFLEVAGITIGTLVPNADLQINTLQQIDEAVTIGQRTITRIDETNKGITKSGKSGMGSYQASLGVRKVEINQSLQALALLRADLMKVLPQQTIVDLALSASRDVDIVGLRSVNSDTTINDALKTLIR